MKIPKGHGIARQQDRRDRHQSCGQILFQNLQMEFCHPECHAICMDFRSLRHQYINLGVLITVKIAVDKGRKSRHARIVVAMSRMNRMSSIVVAMNASQSAPPDFDE